MKKPWVVLGTVGEFTAGVVGTTRRVPQLPRFRRRILRWLVHRGYERWRDDRWYKNFVATLGRQRGARRRRLASRWTIPWLRG